MRHLKTSLEKGGLGVLEMPTGTGKTVTLLSLIISWIYAIRHGYRPSNYNNQLIDFQYPLKLVYCCRTLGEINKTMLELKRVWSLILNDNPEYNILAICLSSRKTYCIHEEVSEIEQRALVDSTCRDITTHLTGREQVIDSTGGHPDIENMCRYFVGYQESIQDSIIMNGIFTFEELKAIGHQHGICPYFLARRLIPIADVVVYSYPYMLDPFIHGIISESLSSQAIVLFDEAHNIDDVCNESLSVKINRPTVDKAIKNVRHLSQELLKMKVKDMERLNREYQDLMRGLDIAVGSSNPEERERRTPFPCMLA